MSFYLQIDSTQNPVYLGECSASCLHHWVVSELDEISLGLEAEQCSYQTVAKKIKVKRSNVIKISCCTNLYSKFLFVI